ncbi:hypothetical protein [Paguma larvata torque teno virus]|uniref:Capsid protein n=1 Tax=Paguma larvata torque teno virus TaxID=2219036 RepID=A0A348BSR5_9VIRU|nr:hypothetical protein QKL50_gp3 [Paguma larvata torque teno virus]BBE36952.1 hypothetical protein [Paguma larvata torque teno virus]
MVYFWRKRQRRRRYWRPRRYKRGYGRRSWRKFRGRRRFYRRRRGIWVGKSYPRRSKIITVRGWEPLGNICVSDTAQGEAKPYDSLDSDKPGNAVWHGTWGHHWFTIKNLIKRAYAGWNRWSSDWTTYDYIKFCGGNMWPMQNRNIDYLFGADPFALTTDTFTGTNSSVEKKTEEAWIHPGVLFTNSGNHWIRNSGDCCRRRFYRIRVKPPSAWNTYYRFDQAQNFICSHWWWTWFDPNQCFWDPSKEGSPCTQLPWWHNSRDWQNRKDYNTNNKWGPFLPSTPYESRFKLGTEGSLWFQYKLYFKVSGDSIFSTMPRDPVEQGYIPDPGSKGKRIQPRSKYPHAKRRMQSTDDILPGDLDSDGILTDEALARITAAPIKRRKVGFDKVYIKYI